MLTNMQTNMQPWFSEGSSSEIENKCGGMINAEGRVIKKLPSRLYADCMRLSCLLGACGNSATHQFSFLITGNAQTHKICVRVIKMNDPGRAVCHVRRVREIMKGFGCKSDVRVLADRLLGTGQIHHSSCTDKGYLRIFVCLFVTYAARNFSAGDNFSFNVADFPKTTCTYLINISRILAYINMSRIRADEKTPERKRRWSDEEMDCLLQSLVNSTFPWMKAFNSDKSMDDIITMGFEIRFEAYFSSDAMSRHNMLWHYDSVPVEHPDALTWLCVYCDVEFEDLCGTRVCKMKHAPYVPRRPGNPYSGQYYIAGKDATELDLNCKMLSTSKIHEISASRYEGFLHPAARRGEEGFLHAGARRENQGKNRLVILMMEEAVGGYERIIKYFGEMCCKLDSAVIDDRACAQAEALALALSKVDNNEYKNFAEDESNIFEHPFLMENEEIRALVDQRKHPTLRHPVADV